MRSGKSVQSSDEFSLRRVWFLLRVEPVTSRPRSGNSKQKNLPNPSRSINRPYGKTGRRSRESDHPTLAMLPSFSPKGRRTTGCLAGIGIRDPQKDKPSKTSRWRMPNSRDSRSPLRQRPTKINSTRRVAWSRDWAVTTHGKAGT